MLPNFELRYFYRFVNKRKTLRVHNNSFYSNIIAISPQVIAEKLATLSW